MKHGDAYPHIWKKTVSRPRIKMKTKKVEYFERKKRCFENKQGGAISCRQSSDLAWGLIKAVRRGAGAQSRAYQSMELLKSELCEVARGKMKINEPRVSAMPPGLAV